MILDWHNELPGLYNESLALCCRRVSLYWYIQYLCNLTSSVSAFCVTLFIIARHSNLNRICWFQTIAEIIRREYSWIQELVELVLDWGDDSNLFMKLSVKEIMWGYEDPLLKKVKAILQKYVNTTTFDDKFGLFYNVRIFYILYVVNFH